MKECSRHCALSKNFAAADAASAASVLFVQRVLGSEVGGGGGGWQRGQQRGREEGRDG